MGPQSTEARVAQAQTEAWLRCIRPRALARTLLLGCMLAASSGAALAQTSEFKCYIVTDGGATQLRLLETTDLGHAQMAAGAPLKVGKKKKLAVREVVECQPAHSPFVDPLARALDERTPR